MNDSSQHFNNADDESEITITTPRFDETEARRAHPVVPLDAVRRSRPDVGKAHATFRRGGRRWPLSVIAVALLAVVGVGGITTTVLRRAYKAQPAAYLIDAPAILRANAAQAAVAIEMRDEASTSRAPRRMSAAGEPRSARDEESFPASEILRRVAREGFEGEDEDRSDEAKDRGRRRKHDDDDERRESRKDSNRAKKGAARLVDILTGPR